MMNNPSRSVTAGPILTGINALIGLLVLLKRSRWAYYLLIGLLSLITVLSVTDEFRAADLAVLILAVAPLVMLVKDRKWYFQKYGHRSQSE